jgi:ubiquinone/menaquinone biosynthesis C-methylase UbiE
MTDDMREKELAYRYDLFITPDWRDRFDTLVNENVELPVEGRILDVNCGTGAHAIEIAERMKKGKAEVVGIDQSPSRIALAEAKANVKKLNGVRFQSSSSAELPFPSDEFDAVIGDASMLAPSEIESLWSEMVRVARPGGRVTIKLATHGSFDEFFSIYWETLHDCGLESESWSGLEGLIRERGTISDAETMARRVGLNNVESVSRKEEFFYESGREFLEAPLIEDFFLQSWLAIVPPEKRATVLDHISSLIERERMDGPFDISIKATVISGIK